MQIWLKEDYDKFLPQLEMLSRNQLAYLAKKTGVIFDEPKKVSKEEFLLVLDETDPDKLKKEFNKIAKNLKIPKIRIKTSRISNIEKIGQSPICHGYGNEPVEIKIKK